MIEKHFGIEIDPTWQGLAGNTDTFVSGVRQVLGQILRSQAGKILARSLLYHNKMTLLQPYEGQDCNAQEWYWGNREDNYSVVRFRPGTCGCDAPCKSQKNASLPHEVLFHELVHSLRRVSGHMHSWTLKKSDLAAYGDSEEFIAVVVTNIFISDVTNHNKSGLRADEVSHTALDPKLAESFRFYASGTKAFNLISSFCAENRGFATQLAHVHASFNPVAAFYKNRQKAFNIAADGDSAIEFDNLPPMSYVQRPDGTWVRLMPFPER